MVPHPFYSGGIWVKGIETYFKEGLVEKAFIVWFEPCMSLVQNDIYLKAIELK